MWRCNSKGKSLERLCFQLCNKVQWQPWKMSRVQSSYISHPPCTKRLRRDLDLLSVSSRDSSWRPHTLTCQSADEPPVLARRVHDFPWHELLLALSAKGRTPPREIFPGGAIVVIIILNDCAIRPTVSYRRETGVLYFSMRNPATLASRDVNDNWGSRRFPFPRRTSMSHRLVSLSHGRYQRPVVEVVQLIFVLVANNYKAINYIQEIDKIM